MQTERFITSLDGTKLYTTSDGHGQSLILCDGLGCSGYIWKYLKPALQQRYQVVHWHYRGHGFSEPAKDLRHYRMQDFRSDLQAVIMAYDLRQPILLGHSMGVQVALDCAIHHSQAIAAMVLICGSYGRPLDTLYGYKTLQLFKMFQKILKYLPKQAQLIWQQMLRSEQLVQFLAYRESNPMLLAWQELKPYVYQLSHMSVSVFFEVLQHIQQHTMEDCLSDVKVPSLIVAAEKDSMTPLWLSKRMHQLLPKAQFVLLKGCSHVAPLEAAEKLQMQIISFLEKLTAVPLKDDILQTAEVSPGFS